jgi:Cu/Ag efflux pump CusA
VVRQDVLSKYNLALAEVNQAVTAGLGGQWAGRVLDGNRRRDIMVRLPEADRELDERIQQIPIRVGEFGMLDLGEVVDLSTESSVDPIRHHRTQRRAALMVGFDGAPGFLTLVRCGLRKPGDGCVRRGDPGAQSMDAGFLPVGRDPVPGVLS